MGAQPKGRTSKGRRDRRRSHMALNEMHLVVCPQCKSLRLPHRICPTCGFYRGTEIIEVEAEK